MTAYAGREKTFPFGRIVVELRSLNHRYLDLHPRLPEDFRALEGDIRELLGKRLKRGKVDITIRFHPQGDALGAALELDQHLARNLLEIHEQLETLSGHRQQAGLLELMKWPGVVTETAGDMRQVHSATLELLEQAASDLNAAREREGEKISAMLRQRLDSIDDWVKQVSGWLPEIREKLQKRLAEKVAAIADVQLDAGRLEQEIALLAQKMDVDEELDRLRAHVSEARHVLEMDEPVGRRLDFLMQEFNRESNTLGSKSVDEKTSRASVELKVLIEQMREQIQNVE